MSFFVRGGVLLVVLVGLAAGCGPTTNVVVKGTVTLDGTPVESGSIDFFPEDDKGATAGGAITAGSFAIEVPPGAKLVSIHASKVLRREPMYAADPNGPMKDIRGPEIIPANYNAKTTLKLTVKSGMEAVKYELTSK